MPQGRRLMYSAHPPKVELESFELAAPRGNEVLIQNTHTQVSAGSEANFLRFGPQSYGLPADCTRANIGYMAVGRIIAAGPDVKGFRVGDRVFSGTGHASHALVAADGTTALDPVPDAVSDLVAGYASLGDVALHAIRRAQLQIDGAVVIFGMGVVGQLVCQLAAHSGAHPIIAVDLIPERLRLANLSGATATIAADKENVVDKVLSLTEGAGAETVFHCAQAAEILQTAMTCAADRGRVILTGSPPGTATIRLKEELLRKELVVTGTYEAGLNSPHVYWRWSRVRNRRTILRLLADKKLSLDHLVTHVQPAEEAQQTYARMLQDSRDWLGIVFRWQDRG